MKLNLVFFAMLYCWCSVAGAVENCINWHENPKLQWNDFQGAVSENSPFAAMTYWYLYYNWKGNKIQADSCFQTNKSWIREGKESDYLLQHEQLHVDIAQLHIRLFKQKIESVTSIAQVKKVFDEILKAAKQMQAQYDEETEHSRDKAEQKRWNRLVAEKLEKLDNYGSDRLIMINGKKDNTESKQPINLKGSWETDFGTLKLQQRGKTVSGTYNYVDSDDEAVHGTVSGTLTGRVLELLWNEEDESSGTARLKFSQDGLSFDGTWRDAEGDESGEWHGTKQ
jgi:Bacterial protein of unknown function (DUF922)